MCTSDIILYNDFKVFNCLLYVVQNLDEQGLMPHLRCGAEVEAPFSAKQATSFLPAKSKCIFSICVYTLSRSYSECNLMSKEQQDILAMVHGADLIAKCLALIYTFVSWFHDRAQRPGWAPQCQYAPCTHNHSAEPVGSSNTSVNVGACVFQTKGVVQRYKTELHA